MVHGAMSELYHTVAHHVYQNCGVGAHSLTGQAKTEFSGHGSSVLWCFVERGEVRKVEIGYEV